MSYCFCQSPGESLRQGKQEGRERLGWQFPWLALVVIAMLSSPYVLFSMTPPTHTHAHRIFNIQHVWNIMTRDKRRRKIQLKVCDRTVPVCTAGFLKSKTFLQFWWIWTGFVIQIGYKCTFVNRIIHYSLFMYKCVNVDFSAFPLTHLLTIWLRESSALRLFQTSSRRVPSSPPSRA